MSSHIDRYEHGERSMLVFISTVMNMWNGRCEMTFSLLSPDFFNAFARFSQSYYPIICPDLFSVMRCFVFRQALFCLAKPLNSSRFTLGSSPSFLGFSPFFFGFFTFLFLALHFSLRFTLRSSM